MADQVSSPVAVIFDLGGTLVHWPDWEADSPRRWGLSYDYLASVQGRVPLPDRTAYVRAMLEAEAAHWRQVDEQQLSGPPSSLIADGFARLGLAANDDAVLAAIDGYARAVAGWAVAYPDARATLEALRSRGYILGLLSNTWWAAEWHNADLAVNGLADLLDEVVYTSDLSHSKPHPSVFLEVAQRLLVEPEACVMVGDRLIDDIGGALTVGMRAVWKPSDVPSPRPSEIVPTATITTLSELPRLVSIWSGG